MYTQKVSITLLDKIYNTYLNFDKSILYALKNQKYNIFFHFDEIDESIVYEAILKDTKVKNLPPYLAFKLTPLLKMDHVEYNDYHISDSYLYQFYYYILKRDYDLLNNDTSTYYSIYQNISFLKDIINLDEEALKIRNMDRRKYANLINEINNLSINTENIQDIRLEINLEKINDNYFLSLRIGKEKMYQVSSIFELLNAVKTEGFYHYGKELGFIHHISSFTPTSQKLISFLSQIYIYEANNDKKMKLFPSTLIALLQIYKDSIITLNDHNYYIDKIESVVSITYQDNLIFSPSFYNKEFFCNNKKGVLIDNENYLINILNFENSFYEKLYSFYYHNQNINPLYIDDLFKSEILPYINGEKELKKSYLSEKIVSYKINLFIDFDLEALSFKTEYLKDDIVITYLEAIQDITFRQKILNYQNVLSTYKIKDNDKITDQQTILDLLNSSFKQLNEVCEVYLSENLKNKKITKMKKVKIKALFDIDWLDLEIQSSNYTLKEINDILSNYRSKKKFYILKDDIISLDDDNLDTLSTFISNYFDKKEKVNNIPLYHAFSLNAYKDIFDVEYDKEVFNIINQIKNFKKQPYLPSIQFQKVLRPYQLEAFKWLMTLYNNHLNGILADDMGLGKTLELISFIACLKVSEPILIIAPKSLLYNWENEFKLWANELQVNIIDGNKDNRLEVISSIKNNNIYITSYDSLRNDLENYLNIKFALLILDEGQYIKNADALKTKAVKEINAKSKFVLSGTPIENSLQDLWSIFDFLMPDYLLSFDEFRKEYENLIIQNKDEYAKKRLISKITPFILSRKKEDVLKELPPKIEQVEILNLNSSQQELYDVYIDKAKYSLKQDNNKISTLALITRLREICLDPSLFIDNYTFLSEKLSYAIELIKKAISNHHKLLIFSSFKKALDHLKILLDQENILNSFIHGQVNASKRLNICNEFNQNDDIKVMLISLKAGGTGLNLTSADIVIHLDPWWNIASENQASDRAHRIGQINKVTVIKLVSKNTIEEKVITLQKLKKSLVNDIISSSDKSITSLSDKDIEFLLS